MLILSRRRCYGKEVQEAFNISRDYAVMRGEEFAHLDFRLIIAWHSQYTLLPVGAIVVDDYASIVGARSTQRMRLLEIDEVNTLLVFLHRIPLTSFLICSAVIIQPYSAIPRGRNEYILFSPVV